MGKPNYSEKLKDPRWQKLRLEIFERDNWTCQVCCLTTKTLAVHHSYYIAGCEPWDYPVQSLITLCEDCHSAEPESRQQAETELLGVLKQFGFTSEDLGRISTEIIEGRQIPFRTHVLNEIKKFQEGHGQA
jgi:hypothetical protein